MTLAKLIPYTNMTKTERYSVIQKFSIHGATILNFLNTFSLIVGFTTRYMQQRGNSTNSRKFGSLPAVVWVIRDLAMLVPTEWANKQDLPLVSSLPWGHPSPLLTGQLAQCGPET